MPLTPECTLFTWQKMKPDKFYMLTQFIIDSFKQYIYLSINLYTCCDSIDQSDVLPL